MKLLFIFLLFSITITFSQTWERFTTENSDLPFNSIDNIVIDSNDYLWIFNNNSIFMYKQNEDKWIEFNESNSNLTNGFTHIVIGIDNSVYVSSNNIYKFDSKSMDFEIKEKDIKCNKFAFDKDGKLFYVNQFYVYSKIDNKRIFIYNGQVDGPNYPTDLLIENNEILWFAIDGYTNALYRYDGIKLDTLDSIFKENPRIGINSISMDKKSNLWLGNGQDCSILKYNINQNSWINFNNTNSPLGKEGMFLKALKTDKNNNVWVISAIYNSLPPISLFKYDGSEWSEFSIDKAFDISAKDKFALLSLAVDSKNNVWIGSNQGLIKFNEAKTSVSTFEENNIKLYPNPTDDVLYIDLSDKHVLSYSITDITGKILKQDFHNFKNQITIDTKSLTTGIYFINLKLSDNQTIQSKFVKE